jgi:thymidylate synthase
MSDGFPLLTTKKMAFKTMVTELLWFLRGDTNIKYLVENGCHIWDGDAYKNYVKKSTEDHVIETHKEVKDGFIHPELITQVVLSLSEFIERIKTDSEFAAKWGELGPIYGKQWRSWNTIKWETTDKIDPLHPDRPMLKWNLDGIDQIANLINDLKTNPDSRRLMVNAWNVGEIDSMVLPPCHYGFQVYTRELSLTERCEFASQQDKVRNTYGQLIDTFGSKEVEKGLDDSNVPKRAISLMWNQRSCDFPLGIPMNISSYALLLMMIAKQVNMVPDELIGNFGDCHIYLNQVDGIKEQLSREPYSLPAVRISDKVVKDISEYTIEDIILEDYKYHPAIKMPLSN